MNYSIERNGKIVIFTIKQKKITTEHAPKLKAEILIVSQPDIDALIFDISQVESMESSGLGSLLLAHRQLKEEGIPVVLVGTQPMVRMLISISQIEYLFEYFDTIDEAIASLEEN